MHRPPHPIFNRDIPRSCPLSDVSNLGQVGSLYTASVPSAAH